MIFLLAGSDSTANTFSFVAYSLALHPEIQNKLHQEIEKAFNEYVIIGFDEALNKCWKQFSTFLQIECVTILFMICLFKLRFKRTQ